MKSIFLVSALLLSSLAHAETKNLSDEALNAANVVRSLGARSCFATLENGGGQLSFESITLNTTKAKRVYTINGSTLVQGDIMAGSWTVVITSESRAEEGTVTSCVITKNEE